MQNCTGKIYHKTVIINRAVSGSGKTTLSRCLTEALRAKALTVAVHSTDDFFLKDGRYAFDPAKLEEFHAQNQTNFEESLKQGTDVVICDNMNLLPWQSKPYTDAARKYGYRILFLNFLPRELEKHVAAQIVTPEKPDAHNIPKDVLVYFIQSFNDYNDLLDKNTPLDITRHKKYAWDSTQNKPVDTGELEDYFDSDAVLTIPPAQYQECKQTLAPAVLKFMAAAEKNSGSF